MKDCDKNANIRFSKYKTSKYQSSFNLINDNTMEKSALITEKINIQLNYVRKESRRRFYESKEKMEKDFPMKANTQPLTFEKSGPRSIRQWKKGTTLIAGDSMLAGTEEKATSRDNCMKYYLWKTLLKNYVQHAKL